MSAVVGVEVGAFTVSGVVSKHFRAAGVWGGGDLAGEAGEAASKSEQLHVECM